MLLTNEQIEGLKLAGEMLDKSIRESQKALTILEEYFGDKCELCNGRGHYEVTVRDSDGHDIPDHDEDCVCVKSLRE